MTFSDVNHAHDTQLGGAPDLSINIRPITPDDRAYVRATWRESYKESSATYLRMPWPLYKQTVAAKLEAAADNASLLGAYVTDGRLAGWLAYTPGRAVDTVHWVYTRHALDGTPCRRRGVMSGLIASAQLGNRIAYTHRGPRPVVHRGRRDRSPDAERSGARGPTSDLALAEWLRAGGRSVVFVPYEEWSR